jgi:hypothetical protein
VAIVLSGAATSSEKPSAAAAPGAWGQLADHQGQVADRDGDQHEARVGQPGAHAEGPNHSASGWDSVLAPNAAEKKPARVTPTWTAARKRLGSLSSR